MSREAWSVRCGLVAYDDALAAQRGLAAARQAGVIPDTLLLLEHPPVYTKGRRHDPAELPMGEDWYRMQGIEVCETDRGGRVTYHGPGQLVGYPIVDLAAYADDVHAFVRALEQVMLGALGGAGVECQIIDGLTGIWTLGQAPLGAGAVGPQGTAIGPARGTGEARKIGAIGVHVAKGVTTHGFAVNVDNDLQPFEWIVPCGIDSARATSLTRELGERQEIDLFARLVSDAYEECLGVELSGQSTERLAEAVPAAASLAEAAVALGR